MPDIIIDPHDIILGFMQVHPDLWIQSGEDETAFLGELARNEFITWTEHDYYLSLLTTPAQRIPMLPELDKVTRRSLGDALFDKIAGYFDVMWERFWQHIAEPIDILYKRLEIISADLKRAIVTRIYNEGDILPEQMKYLPESINRRIREFKQTPTLLDAIVLILFVWILAMGRISGYIAATMKEAMHKANKDIAPELPDIGTLMTVYQRYDSDRRVVLEKARELGYDDTEIELFLKAMLPQHDVYNLRDMLLRGIISEKEHDLRLYQQGFNTTQIEQIKALYQYIPNPPDLVRMAVREAWADEYAKTWGSDAEYPKEFEQAASKQGMSPAWSKRFWRAHWEIPSSMQGFEMLQRGIIDRKELDQLLKAMDIMPGWRERLTKISYLPLTRVDVRRMYQVGVLTRDEVFQSYKELGYDDINAGRMTEFTIRFASEAEKDLTKADVLSVYQRRMLSYDDTKALIVNMGYDPNEADVLITKVDYDIAKKEKDTVLKNIAKAYKRGILSEVDVYSRTSQIGMLRLETEQLILQWGLEIQDIYAVLPRPDLDKLFKGKKITEEEYRTELVNMLYSTKHIEWLVALNTL